jgi:hypothetical protein
MSWWFMALPAEGTVQNKYTCLFEENASEIFVPCCGF